MNVGDRIFLLDRQVWGIAKAIVPEASLPVLFVQDDFGWDQWGEYSEFVAESVYESNEEAERIRVQKAKQEDAERKRVDASRDELMSLLSRFVKGVNLRETLRSTLQTRYVCPLCSEALLLPAGVELSTDAIATMPHKITCDWFRAYALLKDFKVL